MSKSIQRRMKEKASLLKSKSQRAGAIIVLFAVLLPLLVLILGFTIDYAYMQRSRNEVRVVSDLAVRAAADTLARTGGDETAAMDAARFIAANNTVAGENVILRDDQIVFGRSYRQLDGSYSYVAGDSPANSVQVIAKRDDSSVGGPISTFFGATYGRPTFEVAEVAEASFRDVEIVLVLDRSGSMKFSLAPSDLNEFEKQQLFKNTPKPNSRWTSLDTAIDLFLSELESTPVKETVGLVTFAENSSREIKGETVVIERVSLDSSLSKDLNQLRSNMDDLNNLIWFGRTNITAGLEKARLHFEDSGSANVDKIIICLTDGKHNAADVDAPNEEAARCLDAGITVHTITFSEGANEADMILTAEDGGGNHSHAPDEDSLKLIFKRLAGSVAFISK